MTRPDLVEFEHASTPFEAKVIAAVLAAADIPAFIDGEQLTDEFAAAQRLMNLRGTTIMVPAAAADRARAAIEAARAAGRAIAEDAHAADAADRTAEASPSLGGMPGDSGAPGLWTVLLGLGFVISTIGWISSSRAAPEDPLYRTQIKSDGVLTILRATGNLRWAQVDADGDGIYEEVAVFDRDGREIDRSFDLDGDGFIERCTLLAPDGKAVQELRDTDSDGRVDQWIQFDPNPARGWRSIRTDPNGDGHFERREIQRKDGSIVLVEIDRFERGFVREN